MAMLLETADGRDCAHHRYPSTCPDCTGVVVQGSTVALAVAIVLVALDLALAVRAWDIEGDHTAAVVRALVAGLGAW